MPDTSIGTTRRPRRRLAEIKLANDTLVPRDEFARNELGASPRTAKRMNLPTTYIGGVAYVARNASLEILAATVRRRNEASKRRHRAA